MTFRCSAACEERAESLAGTASTVRAYLLVEHPGPWGNDALRDARLPPSLGPELRRRSRAAHVRTLLVRRPAGASRHRRTTRVFAGVAHHLRPFLQTTELDRVEDVLDLELEALGAGASPGLTDHDQPLLAVCTHGRHDACCAERGRPVVAALQARHAELTWEVSHIGGDRFAGNLLVLPWGLYFGRVDPATAPGLADDVLRGELDLDRLRGRSSLAMPLQAAEIALRRHLGVRRLDAVRCQSRSVEAGLTEAVFEVDGDTDGGRSAASLWSVSVRSSLTEDTARLTCHAQREGHAARHEVLSIEAIRARAS